MSWLGRLFGRISWVVGIVLGAFIFGFAFVILFTTQLNAPGKALAAGCLFALAALISGGLIGFLFGIPRANAESPSVAGGHQVVVRPNTNLEQISDWLTKILVGLTLTQLPAIGATVSRLIDTLARELGGEPNSPAFAGALLVYFSVFGFIGGWLLTSLRLPRAMVWAGGSQAKLLEAAELSAAGRKPQAQEKIKEAVAALKLELEPSIE